MSEDKKFDFTKHQLPKASKWYLFKLVFYITVLTILLWLIFRGGNAKKTNLNEDELTEMTIKPKF